jgi:predicted NAD/FAD-binding protein
MRIAIVGAGIAGLGSARLLQRQGHGVTLYESGAQLGGHTRTLDVTLDGVTAPVDTGFLVFNDRTYPRLVELFAELGVESVASEMSFSVRNDAAGLEWAGTSAGSLFASPANALRPAFWRMLGDILRVNSRNAVSESNDSTGCR